MPDDAAGPRESLEVASTAHEMPDLANLPGSWDRSHARTATGHSSASPTYPPTTAVALNEPLATSRPASVRSHRSRVDSSNTAGGDAAEPPAAPAPAPAATAVPVAEAADADVPPTPASAMTPALQARVSVYSRVRAGISSLGGRSRLSLFLGTLVAFGQIVAYSTVLGITARESQSCDRPLRTYLVLFIIKTGLYWPLGIYQTFMPRRPRAEEDTAAERQRREERRIFGNAALDRRINTIKDLISLFSFIWFLAGNVWVLGPGSQCKATSPAVWWSSLASLILAYLRIAEIVAIVFLVAFFFPMVIFAMHRTGLLEKKHEVDGLKKDEVDAIPIVFYIPKEEDEKPAEPRTEATADNAETPASAIVQPAASAEQSPAEPVQQPQQQAQTRQRWGNPLRLFIQRRRARRTAATTTGGATPSTLSNGLYMSSLPHPVHALPDNWSTCPICLLDYEAPPLAAEAAQMPPADLQARIDELMPLNLLPCRHAIHKACLGGWLEISGRCPICQQAIYPDRNAQQKKRTGRVRRLAGQGEPDPPAGPGAAQPGPGNDNNV